MSAIKLSILLFLAQYGPLTRLLLQALCKPGKDPSGRIMREHLTQLRHEGFICKTVPHVVFPDRNGAPMPVHYISSKGTEYLAGALGDDRYLQVCTATPDHNTLYHLLRCNEFHILLDSAIEGQDVVRVEQFVSERDVLNPDDPPSKHIRLPIVVQEQPRRIICKPDGAFVIAVGTFKKIIYLETDCESTGRNAIAARKTPGFALLAEHRLHAKQFPSVNPEVPFMVLHISPNPGRRDLVAKAVKGKPAEKYWKFAAWSELSRQTLLHGEILRDVDLKPFSLVKRVEGPKESQNESPESSRIPSGAHQAPAISGVL